MTVFTDAIADGLAQLTRVVLPPGDPLGYGSDLDCVSDVTEDVRELDPLSPLGIAQRCIRRLTCPRGALPDDKSYGYDLTALLNRGATDADLREYATNARAECRKDDDVDDALVTIVMTSIRDMSVRVQIKPVDPNKKAFDFVFALTDAGAALQTISGA